MRARPVGGLRVRGAAPALCGAALALSASGCVGSGKPSPESVGDVCALVGEETCIGRTNGLAERAPGTLRLRLDDGRVLRFSDVAGGCEPVVPGCAGYRLDGYRPLDGLFIVERRAPEGVRRVAIARSDGAATDPAPVDGRLPF